MLVRDLARFPLILLALSVAFLASPSPASASSFSVPPVSEITATIPGGILLPETQVLCLVRLDNTQGTVSAVAVCYATFSPDPPPSLPLPAYQPAPTHILLSGDLTGNMLTINIFPCLPVADSVAQLDLKIPLDKQGGSVSGPYVVWTMDDCGSGTEITGALAVDPLPLDTDTDGDGCTDWYELGENTELGGLNDPFNPNDCDGIAPGAEVLTSDGLYEISHDYVGGYRRCRGFIDDDATLDMRVYCYTDGLGVKINPEAYNVSGDGVPGAPPPGPEDPGGSGNVAYGDVNETHTVLAGTYDDGTNVVTFTGCFDDLDGHDPLGDIYVEWDWNVQTGAGNSKMWAGQCSGGQGGDIGTLHAAKLATTAQLNVCYRAPPFGSGDCPFADTDGDGVPDSRELLDDSACGRRDPFNPHDYYDVSIPRDGVIDLANDILGVILHFAPGGADPGDENWNRPQKMNGAGSHWNRGSPDSVIDLANDILGVILQFNSGGCLQFS